MKKAVKIIMTVIILLNCAALFYSYKNNKKSDSQSDTQIVVHGDNENDFAAYTVTISAGVIAVIGMYSISRMLKKKK